MMENGRQEQTVPMEYHQRVIGGMAQQVGERAAVIADQRATISILTERLEVAQQIQEKQKHLVERHEQFVKFLDDDQLDACETCIRMNELLGERDESPDTNGAGTLEDATASTS